MTDARLEAALERAAELVDGYRKNLRTLLLAEYLAGWAEAVKLLNCWHQDAYEESDGSSLMPPVMHDGICGAACDDPCKPCQAIAKFITAMLRKEADGE